MTDTILITGAAGQLGRGIIRHLLEARNVAPASIIASRACRATALSTAVVWSLLSSPDSSAPAKSTTVGIAVKRKTASVSESHRTSANTGAGSGRAR